MIFVSKGKFKKTCDVVPSSLSKPIMGTQYGITELAHTYNPNTLETEAGFPSLNIAGVT